MNKKGIKNSLRAYLKKEFIEGVRTHKFLIIAAAVIFFAVADPVMLKLLPKIVESQMPGMDFSSFYEMNQKMAMTNLASDLYEISTFIFVMVLMGIISGERRDKTLTIPVSTGCSISGVLMSKISVYGVFLTVITVAGMLISYVYSGLIFNPDFASYGAVIRTGLLYGCFYLFVISVIAFMNSLVDKPFISGILTLLVVYLMPLLGNIKGAGRFFPFYLVNIAKQYSVPFAGDLIVTLLCTLIMVVLLNVLTVVRLRNIEFV